MFANSKVTKAGKKQLITGKKLQLSKLKNICYCYVKILAELLIKHNKLTVFELFLRMFISKSSYVFKVIKNPSYFC